MKLFLLPILVLLLTGCDGGGTDLEVGAITPTPEPTSQPSPTPTPAPTVLPTTVNGDTTISGYITYDQVPHNDYGGLEYAEAYSAPAKSIAVQLLDENDTVIRQSQTDSTGFYTMGAPTNTFVRVVARAQLLKRMANSNNFNQWEFNVLDNTADNAIYMLAGELLDSGENSSERNLHAASGWNISSNAFFDETNRPAAPFAILNAVYQAVMTLEQADRNVVLPRCDLYWSHKNTSSTGDVSAGYIETSHYVVTENSIYLLGDAYNDTDEYDFSVIQHEFSHFVEDSISRSDSIGGGHGLRSKLDMRVAFSEGLANAFTGIVSGQPYYMDSAGTENHSNFRFSMEDNTINNKGWFNENSIGKILYDLNDDENEYGDDLSLSYEAIYSVLVNSEFIDNDALASIFLFNDVFYTLQGSAVESAYNALLTRELISSVDRYGQGETNSGSTEDSLPVYNILSIGENVISCSSNENGEDNGLGVSQFYRFQLAGVGIHTISISRDVDTSIETNPDARLYSNGQMVSSLNSAEPNDESSTFTFGAGEYVLEVFDQLNADGEDQARERSCFSVSIN